MSTKPLDTFILNSVSLLEANPSESLVSINYKNGDGHSKVHFKTHNPHLGTTFKYSTCKLKDVSRLLSALGPRGVSVTSGKIEKQRNKKKVKDVRGMSTLLVNAVVPEAVEEVSQTGASTSSKKNKKKNKNKRR
ncbi:LAMI_0G04720g1_1 [Lachancea mirantina]|uniref:LAMI_0G04720g1_1 n=1 Tax=Lachancea mirantina TaxID=1230905 RepID=A0A1G4K8K8_9SACH|nr:LAMI_0G04720g1_1 [Lachancea mirantina]